MFSFTLHINVRFLFEEWERKDRYISIYSRRTLSRRSWSDVFNVLLNVTIVSVVVHCVYKFISVAPSPHSPIPPCFPPFRVRRRTRTRATLVPNEIYERAIPLASFVCQIFGHRHLYFQISFLSREKKSYISLDGGGIHMLKRFLAKDPFGRSSTFQHGIRTIQPPFMDWTFSTSL